MQLHHPEIRESLNRFTHEEVATDLHTELFGAPSKDSITRRLFLKCFKELAHRYDSGIIEVPSEPAYDWKAIAAEIEERRTKQLIGYNKRVKSYAFLIRVEKDAGKEAALIAERDVFLANYKPITWQSVWEEIRTTEGKTTALMEKAAKQGDLYAAEQKEKEAKKFAAQEVVAVMKKKAAAEKRKAAKAAKAAAGPKKVVAAPAPAPVVEPEAPTHDAISWVKGEEITSKPFPKVPTMVDAPEQAEVINNIIYMGISRPCKRCRGVGMHKCCPKCKITTAQGLDEVEDNFGFRCRSKGGAIRIPQTWCRDCRKNDSAERKKKQKAEQASESD